MAEFKDLALDGIGDGESGFVALAVAGAFEVA